MKKPIIAIGLMIIVGALVAVIALLVRGGGAPTLDAAAVERNNHAVALMERFDYDEAQEVFATLVEQHPDWMDARVNHAIAVLNRQEDGDSGRALALLSEVLESDPDHLRARYCSGLLRLYEGDIDAALEGFAAVADADPADAYAAYYVGQCLAQRQQYAEASQWYRKALDLDPYLRSAYFGLSQAARRIGDNDQADELLEQFMRLEGNPRARLVQFIYLRMGPKGLTLAVDETEATPAPLPDGPMFGERLGLTADRRAYAWSSGAEPPVSVTASDINGDGHVDVFIASALEEGDTVNALFLGDGAGRFALELEHPLASVPGVNAALWGDYDNDGLVDVYLCRRGTNQLWRQTAAEQWEDVTETTATGNGELDTVDGALFDADHDGDLDIFCVNADGPDELLNNNLDGTFRPLAAEKGLAGSAGSRQVLVTDLDGDRDVDIVVLAATPPHGIYLNDRLWSYTEGAEEFEDLRQASITAAVAGDLDADGQVELHTVVADDNLWRWQPDDDGRWRSDSMLDGVVASSPWHRLALADLDGDGGRELALSTTHGWGVLRVMGTEWEPVFGADEPLLGTALVLVEPELGPQMVAMTDGGPLIWPAGSGRHSFTAIVFTGGLDPAAGPPPIRSNRSGIGTLAASRVGSVWTVFDTFRNDSGPGQSLQPMAVGLAGHDHLDFLRLDWSDGVLQTEVHGVSPIGDTPPRQFTAGTVQVIEEIQRVKSSCPVVFVWNGQRHEFVSDVLGVGGIGFALGPGEYAQPRPWERFLLPADVLQPRDGRYVVKIGEPMEEACYLDAARLVAYDLPGGWSMTLDERFGIGGPAPSGRPRFYRVLRRPVAATNDRGDDVLATVTSVDDRAAPVGPLDRRFIGRLQADHRLTLRFDEPLDEGPGQPMLIADGWVEYPYSQTMFAAWQAGAEYRAPTLEAMGSDGRWSVVTEQFGYPAGMPRQMSLPLDGLPPGTTTLRITTNQEVYWDSLAVAYEEQCSEARRVELSLQRAELRRCGFARRPDLPQRRAYYDYTQRLPMWDTRHQTGRYTRFGPVNALVAETDDALAILGPGEEVHMEFGPTLDAMPPGWSRRFVLEADGWCKDMDLATGDGDTVAPIPQSGKPRSVPDELHRSHNTRFESGW